MIARFAFDSLVMVAASALLSGATILVDDFTLGHHTLQISPMAGVPPVGTTLTTTQTGLDPAHVLGGIRRVTLRLDSGDSGNVGSENNHGPTSMGQILLSSDPSASATLVLEYPNLANLDLTVGGSQVGLALLMGEADHLSDYLIEVIDGSIVTTCVQTLGTLQPGITFWFPFDSFSDPSALLSADSIRITLTGEPAGDYGFVRIQTYELPDTGTSLGLLSLGLMTLAISFQRKHDPLGAGDGIPLSMERRRWQRLT